MCEKEEREKRKDIFKVCSKETVADRRNAKLFNICVCIVYMYCDWYESKGRNRFFVLLFLKHAQR